jgi:hypothetical protein
VRHELSHSGQFVPLGSLHLSAGTHLVRLRYDEPALRPGTTGAPFELGPLVLARDTINEPVRRLPPRQARDLCNERLDWVEALKSG